jgi:hypothetical protein
VTASWIPFTVAVTTSWMITNGAPSMLPDAVARHALGDKAHRTRARGCSRRGNLSRAMAHGWKVVGLRSRAGRTLSGSSVPGSRDHLSPVAYRALTPTAQPTSRPPG